MKSNNSKCFGFSWKLAELFAPLVNSCLRLYFVYLKTNFLSK